jgi:ABC-2 type transport system ATP-binding protein
MLCGLLIPSAGSAVIAGVSFADGAPDDLTKDCKNSGPHHSLNSEGIREGARFKIKEKVGYMSQRFTLYNDLTIQENLDFTAGLRNIPSKIYRERLERLLSLIEFRQSTNILVRDLPGGIKQQLALVDAMLHDPEIIFLDEPTAGVAPAVRARFWNLIRKLSDEGKTIFVTTHYMDEAEHCGRLALMRAGQIIALDTPEVLKKKTFPEPIYVLDPGHADASKALAAFHEDASLGTVQPYGVRYHVTFHNAAAEKKWRQKLPAAFTLNRTQPSLEDVFIRLVEGKNR